MSHENSLYNIISNKTISIINNKENPIVEIIVLFNEKFICNRPFQNISITLQLIFRILRIAITLK